MEQLVQEDGSIKKIFVLHFQREDGRVTPEKEHYALIMYDNAGQDNGQPIDEKLYLGGTQMDSLLLETTSGRITLEIVGLSDYAEFAQGSIDKYENGFVSGMADGYFFNPYRDEMQHGVIIFNNLEVGTDPEAYFLSRNILMNGDIKIGKLLCDEDIITKRQLNKALQKQVKGDKRTRERYLLI